MQNRGEDLLSVVPGGRTSTSRLKLQGSSSRLDMKNNVLIVRSAPHWNSLHHCGLSLTRSVQAEGGWSPAWDAVACAKQKIRLD